MTHHPGERRRSALAVALILALSTLPACSFVDSSASISQSIGASFASSSASSRSSSPGDDQTAYKNDVRDYTYAYVRSTKSAGDFERGLAGVAEKHGISNWQSDQTTWVGIGEGLAKARVNHTELEVFKKNLADSDPDHMTDIQRGYDAYRPA
ncbi:MAG TPA: putative lipoprotein [Candidatus Binatia bacterium]|nr:putative lipoprotein [Candidatus Binatia bacterium]